MQSCTGCDVPGRGGPSGSGGSSSDGGAGSGEGGAEEPSEFAVTRFEGPDFFITGPYSSGATLRGERRGGGESKGTWAGSGTVTLERLVSGAFVLVTPTDSTQDSLPTVLSLPENAEEEPLELPLVRATVLDAIFTLPTLPVSAVEGRAQVVFRVGDLRTHLPRAGATITAAGAEVVLYSDGGTWSDAVTETDPTGLVLIANVPAAPWPGRLSTITVSGAVLGSVPYRAVEDAVSVVAAELP